MSSILEGTVQGKLQTEGPRVYYKNGITPSSYFGVLVNDLFSSD